MMPSDIWRMELDAMEKLVALALLDYGKKAFPSQKKLAIKVGASRQTVNRTIKSLVERGLVSTVSRGKALTYTLNDRYQIGTPSCTKLRQEMYQIGTATCTKLVQGSKLSQLTIQPNSGAGQPATGREVFSDEVRARIQAWDARALDDLPGQRKVTDRILSDVGLTVTEREGAWSLLLAGWASDGRRPYDRVVAWTSDLAGARNVRSVVLARIRGVA